MKKFTQEVKDEWLAAIKSGNFVQGFAKLVHIDHKLNSSTNQDVICHCAIGVLGETMEFLNNQYEDPKSDECPYAFLDKNGIDPEIIYDANDYNKPIDMYDITQRNYSKVIPVIESLPVQS